MAFFGFALALPPCKMPLKSSDGTCSDCSYRSCMGLAERNARLYLSGAITRLAAEAGRDESRPDRHVPPANCYERWLLQHAPELPIQRHRSLKKHR